MEKRGKNTKKLQSLQGKPVVQTSGISLNAWKKTIASADLSQIQNEWTHIEKHADELWSYFVLLPFQTQIEMLSYILHEVQIQLFAELFSQDVHTLSKYYSDEQISSLSSALSPEVHEALWHKNSYDIDAHNRPSFTLGFKGDDAEGIMTSECALTIAPHRTAEETLAHIKKNIDAVETIYYVYVVNDKGKLEGVISLRDLMRQKKSTQVQDFMVKNVYSVQKHTDQEVVAAILRENDLLAVPVVDDDNTLQGIVMFSDVIHVIHEEYNEDALHMSAIGSQPQNFTYLESSVFQQFKTRIPWLIFLLVAGTLTSNIISMFNSTITLAHYLILFIPVVTSTGGNIATQSSTLIICGLVRNELSPSDILFVIFKEMIIALLIGLCLGIVMIARGIFFPPQVAFLEATAISFSLVFVVLFSAVIGAVFPLILSKMRLDPTVVATPFMATIIDLLGLTIYFTIARLML